MSPGHHPAGCGVMTVREKSTAGEAPRPPHRGPGLPQVQELTLNREAASRPGHWSSHTLQKAILGPVQGHWDLTQFREQAFIPFGL